MEMDRKALVKYLIFFILFIFIVNFLANKFYWYYSIWYFDLIMHFLGGFWIGLLFFYFFPLKNNSFSVIFKLLLFVFLAGIGWEVYEILVNDIIAQNPFDYFDTISDICFDLSGGLCAILYVLVPLKNQGASSKK